MCLRSTWSEKDHDRAETRKQICVFLSSFSMDEGGCSVGLRTVIWEWQEGNSTAFSLIKQLELVNFFRQLSRSFFVLLFIHLYLEQTFSSRYYIQTWFSKVEDSGTQESLTTTPLGQGNWCEQPCISLINTGSTCQTPDVGLGNGNTANNNAGK